MSRRTAITTAHTKFTNEINESKDEEHAADVADAQREGDCQKTKAQTPKPMKEWTIESRDREASTADGATTRGLQ